jgi:dUTP pyrophosphatase
MMKVKIKLFTDDASFRPPAQATPGSAGWDIYALEDVQIPPMEMRILRTGFGLQIPKGYYISIVPRSSYGKKRIMISNSPATIDSDYTGEISVMLYNNSMDFFSIKKGDRIAQMILLQYNEMEFDYVEQFDITSRGDGGFGSTGQ